MSDLLDATFAAEQRHFWFKGLARFSDPLLEQAMAGRADPMILDCGFGTGANMVRLSKFGRVVGFDLSGGGIEYARRQGQRLVARASATAIPFAADTFDVVTMFDLLACLRDGEQRMALGEVRRVLKPGGAVLLNTAALPILRGSHAVFGDEVHRARRGPLKERLEAAGFRVERITYTNATLLPLMLGVRLAQKGFGLRRPKPSNVDMIVPPSWVNDMLAGLLALEARALRVVDMPLGSSLLALAFTRK